MRRRNCGGGALHTADALKHGRDSTTAINKWDVLAMKWHCTGPPSSPSEQDLGNYKLFLTSAVYGVQAPSILILGCTPGLRRIVAELDMAATCVDASARMLEVSTRQVGIQGKGQELIRCDWLDLNLGRRFDAVLGDKVFDNVPYEDWGCFKSNILHHLSLAGSLIVRAAPQDPTLIGRCFTDLFYEWCSRYTRGEVTCKDAASGLWEQALGASARSVPGRQSIDVFAGEIQRLEDNRDTLSVRQARVLRAYQRLFAWSATFAWTSYSLGALIDSLAEDLVPTRIARSSDYVVGERQPIIEFRQRRGPQA